MFVHSQVPPGTTEMKEKRAEIDYSFEELPDGGRVRISTKNHDALNAVHDFLNFQILGAYGNAGQVGMAGAAANKD
jgi:hypothetical protein